VVAASTPDWRGAVTAEPQGPDTRVAVRDLAARRTVSTWVLRGRLEPRVVSQDGRLVASVTPGGAGIHGLHDPGGRERTTIVVCGPEGERTRLDLPGNLEPEAFSADADLLFVLSYLPASRPQRYTAGVIDLATGVLAPVPGAEEMNAHRIFRVHDPRRDMLFAICSRQEESLAFVHCLHLRQRWARRVALPAPFGQGRPGVHTLALSPAGDRLSVFHSLSATVADIDPDALSAQKPWQLSNTGQDGKPGLLINRSGGVVAAVDGLVLQSEPRREIGTPGQVRGLVPGTGDDLWVGHPNGIVQYNLATAREVRRIDVPGMFVLKHVMPGRPAPAP
jgi:hypothetical protein